VTPSVLPIEADPRPLAALFLRVLGHAVGLHEDGVDPIIGYADVVSRPEDVGDGRRASVESAMEREDTLLEIGWILGVWISARSIQLWNLVGLTVLRGKLLDSSPADVELFGDDRRVDIVIDNTLTDPVDIVLIQPHFTCRSTREVIPTKSFADTTVPFGGHKLVGVALT
jgi:hypothetical protein